MKDHLNELVHRFSDPLRARNTVREYLQARILEAFQARGAMVPLAPEQRLGCPGQVQGAVLEQVSNGAGFGLGGPDIKWGSLLLPLL